MGFHHADMQRNLSSVRISHEGDYEVFHFTATQPHIHGLAGPCMLRFVYRTTGFSA